MKDVDVRFGSGQEVLSSYWGYLSDGGLIIRDSGFEVGEELALRITIASSDCSYQLAGRVVKRQLDSQRAIVAFHPGEPHDMLLTEALAEADNVPARRFRRIPVRCSAEVSMGRGDETIDVEIVNVSREGCCVLLDPAHGGQLPVETHLSMVGPSFTCRGKVVWARNRERGVRFSDSDSIEALSGFIRDELT